MRTLTTVLALLTFMAAPAAARSVVLSAGMGAMDFAGDDHGNAGPGLGLEVAGRAGWVRQSVSVLGFSADAFGWLAAAIGGLEALGFTEDERILDNAIRTLSTGQCLTGWLRVNTEGADVLLGQIDRGTR